MRHDMRRHLRPHFRNVLRLLVIAIALAASPAIAAEITTQSFPLPDGSRPHDVAPAPEPNGPVWYAAQGRGALGKLDPNSGEVIEIPLGDGSRPHGVIVGPNGAPWLTDGGLNAIVRVDPETHEVKKFPLPADTGHANLNTATFDGNGKLWFTGQSGIYGSVDPETGTVTVYAATRGRGPYGIATSADGIVYYASLAGSHIARINSATGKAALIEPPTRRQGARRVWGDSKGRIWVSEWNAGQVSVYDPDAESWQTWKLPGRRPQAYAVYVDEEDIVWLSDFGANAMVRFDPAAETFQSFPSPRSGARVRQILGRAGEVRAPESGTDTIVVYRTQ